MVSIGWHAGGINIHRDRDPGVEAQYKPLLGAITADPGEAKATIVSMGQSKLWPAVATTKAKSAHSLCQN